jgi:alpha-methylacyl-CoA racemase
VNDETRRPSGGPLTGVRVLELAGQGPGPYGCMLLADLGADVVRVDRPGGSPAGPAGEATSRGRRSVLADLKTTAGCALVRRLADRADVLVDPFRPGVLERLDLGPETLMAGHRELVVARVTGWGQTGPWAAHAGHDINYIGLSGALAHIGRRDADPTPPLNLAGDMTGGMLLAFGVAVALVERGVSGRGQVIDVSMLDGSASMMALALDWLHRGLLTETRGANVIDSGAPFYDVYVCADGRYVALGAVEGRFYRRLLLAIGLDPEALPPRRDPTHWSEIRDAIAGRIRTRTRDEWSESLGADPDLCFSPVLTMSEAPDHPHNRARGTFVDVGGIVQPAPVPRFERTPGAVRRPTATPGEHTAEVLQEWLASPDDH